jgi:hypothetical protein
LAVDHHNGHAVLAQGVCLLFFHDDRANDHAVYAVFGKGFDDVLLVLRIQVRGGKKEAVTGALNFIFYSLYDLAKVRVIQVADDHTDHAGAVGF